MAKLPSDFNTYVAWQFESVLPGTFRRNKKDYKDIDFPILAPLPSNKAATMPLDGASISGPFIYFIEDREGEICYVGKSEERTVIKRWVRPGLGGPTSHYWTHTNKTAGCVRQIAEGIQAGHGPFKLKFVSSQEIPLSYQEEFQRIYPHLDSLESIEKGLISMLLPAWNDPKSYR